MPSEVSATVRRNGTVADVTFDGSGAFSFPVADVDEPYAITFHTDWRDYEYQLAAPRLTVVDRLAGRPDRTIAAPGTRVTLALANRPDSTAVGIETVASTGIWSTFGIPSAAAIELDWTAAFGLLEMTQHDALYYIGTQLVNPRGTLEYYQTAYSAHLADVSLAQGTTTALSTTVSPVTPDLCVTVDVERQRESERIAALVPNETNHSTTVWMYATAAPDFMMVSAVGLAVAVQYPPISDLADETIAFANPIADATPYATFTVARQRNFDQGAIATVTSIAVPIEDTRCGSSARLALRADVVAIPTGIALDGRELTADGPVTINPDHDALLSWQLTSTGDAELFVVYIYEVSPTGLGFRRVIFTAERSARLDPSWLVPQHQYLFVVQARLGLPAFANGDVSATGPIWANASAHTPIITAR